MNIPDEAIEAATKALARRIAFSDCLDADMGGYGWDSDNPDHVAHFLPTATRKAAEHARMALSAAAPILMAQLGRIAADAWDEGFFDGKRQDAEGDDGPKFTNPYREADS